MTTLISTNGRSEEQLKKEIVKTFQSYFECGAEIVAIEPICARESTIVFWYSVRPLSATTLHKLTDREEYYSDIKAVRKIYN